MDIGIMGLFKFMKDNVLDPMVDTVVDKMVDAPPNKYPELERKGKFLSYAENQPLIGALLASLGPNRGKLYKALLSENAADMVRDTFFPVRD